MKIYHRFMTWIAYLDTDNKFLEKIGNNYLTKCAEDEEKDFYETYEPIFWAESYDNLSNNDKYSMYGLYDIEILKNKNKNVYTISIETAYCFAGSDKEKEYYKSILNTVTEWIKNNCPLIDLDEEIWASNIISYGYKFEYEYKSLQELYTYTKWFLNSIINNK